MREIFEPKLKNEIKRKESGEQIYDSWIRYPARLIVDYKSADPDLDRMVEIWLLMNSHICIAERKYKTNMIDPKQIATDLSLKGKKGLSRVEESLIRIGSTLNMKCTWLTDKSNRRLYEQEFTQRYVGIDLDVIENLLYSEFKTESVRWRLVTLCLNLWNRIPYYSKTSHDLVCYVSQAKLATELNISRPTISKDVDKLIEMDVITRRKVRKFDGDCYYVYARGGDDSQLNKYCTRIVNEGRVMSYA
jgi:hypothetical protein